MNFILKLIISAAAVFIVAYLLPGVSVENYVTALLVALALAFLNAIVKPILTILTIPITIITLGFFLLVINALIIIFASKLVNGFHVSGFFTALLFSFVLSICTGFLNFLFGVGKED
ncbi:MAG: phage holin family protein [Bacteroidetes bacterium]|nr:phage holin family protein [Bacteroidota bacterium]